MSTWQDEESDVQPAQRDGQDAGAGDMDAAIDRLRNEVAVHLATGPDDMEPNEPVARFSADILAVCTALDAATADLATLRGIVADVAAMNPLQQRKGRDPMSFSTVCTFCGVEKGFAIPGPEHADTCPWLAARRAVERP